MAQKAFLIVQSTNECWVATYDQDKKERKIIGLKDWLVNSDTTSQVDSVEQWLEKNGSTFEAVFPINVEKKVVELSDDELLEYTELIDDLDIY
jgi:site-specific recombinase